MDRCDEVFQRVYETMFEQTDDPLPDVVPVTRELRCQMLQQHLRHSSQRLMQRCGIDRSDADLQRIGAWNAQFCSAVPGRFGARRRRRWPLWPRKMKDAAMQPIMPMTR